MASNQKVSESVEVEIPTSSCHLPLGKIELFDLRLFKASKWAFCDPFIPPDPWDTNYDELFVVTGLTDHCNVLTTQWCWSLSDAHTLSDRPLLQLPLQTCQDHH